MNINQKTIVKRIWKEYMLDALAGFIVGFAVCLLVGSSLAEIAVFIKSVGGLAAIASFIAVIRRSFYNKGIEGE